jgi:DNA-binding CsgD family transcriptional regulator
MSVSIPWSKINDFLLDCGSIRNPKDYGKRIINRIDELIPFDQAWFFLLNDSGEVYDEFLLGVCEMSIKEYHDYYSKINNGNYSTSRVAEVYRYNYPEVDKCIFTWDTYKNDPEFFQGFISPNKIRHCFTLGLRDVYNSLRCLISLERTCNIEYTEREIIIMSTIRPHLDNLFQNFYVTIPSNNEVIKSDTHQKYFLTAREIEVAKLLKQGIHPKKIGETLFISPSTVKKHIANIHAKLNVSTRQELIVKLFNKTL